MSSIGLRSVKSVNVIKHRRHRSYHNHHRQPLKSDIRSTNIIHANILQSSKINPLIDDKVSSVTIADQYSHLSEKSDQQTNITQRSFKDKKVHHQHLSPPEISTARITNHQSSTNEFDFTLSNDFDASIINSFRNLRHSFHDHDEVLNHTKKQNRKKKFGTHCRLCTPLCAILSLFAALFLAIVIATALTATLVKNESSTTTTLITIITTQTTLTFTTTSSTSATTSPTSTSTSSTSSSTSSTSTTTARVCGFSCLNQTWISSSDLLVKWTFDGTFLDEMNTYTAIATNNPSFIANGYVKQALTLNATTNQYLYTSYIPLIDTSFTVELWLYPTGFPNSIDHSILGLCTNLSNDHCLHLTIRKFNSTYHLYMSFFGDSCQSNVSISLSEWIHAAFVFDNVTRTMSIYKNGELVGSTVSVSPLQGIPSNVTIGYIPGIVATYGNNYFQGYFDHLIIVRRAKSACEILDDATLATYYNFDNSPILNDSGPNSLSSTSQSVSFLSSGHSSKAISFNDSTAYVQIIGLTGLGIFNKPFSISFWIRPYSLSGTIVFVTSTALGTGWCVSVLGFATNGSVVAQVWSGAVRSVFGPAMSTSSVWYHIVETWSTTNGLRLYIDNVLVASDTSAITYMASSASNYVRIANRPVNVCALGSIGSQTAFSGGIDEFKIYSRELTADDICTL